MCGDRAKAGKLEEIEFSQRTANSSDWGDKMDLKHLDHH